MSKALKCDRCHKFFDPGDMEEKEFFTTIRGYDSQKAQDYRLNECWNRHDEAHLCSTCSKLFSAFMKGSDIYEKNNSDPIFNFGSKYVVTPCECGRCVDNDTYSSDSSVERTECTTEKCECGSPV